MGSGSLFNKLWVIESLPKGDLKTGTNLVENQLNTAKLAQPDFEVELLLPKTKANIITSLEKIRNETRDLNSYPMIHFECHGCKEGISSANNELISWDDLRITLLEINQACKMNLVVVLAACNGIYLVKAASKLDGAPFYAIVGPEAEVIAGDIQLDFGAYYSKYFENFDHEEAISESNRGLTDSIRKYNFISAESIFIRMYIKYHNTHLSGKGKRQKVEYLVTQIMESDNTKRLGVKRARQFVKNSLKNNEEANFDDFKRTFFLIDQFKENQDRFAVQYLDVLSKCNPNN